MVFDRIPAADFKIVRDDARALLQLGFEHGAHFDVRLREQIYGDDVGGGVVLLQDVAVDDAGRVLQAELADLCFALDHEVVIELDAGRVGMISLRGHDYDAAVAAAEVEHFLAGLQLAKFEHAVDDGLRGRIVGSEFFAGGAELRHCAKKAIKKSGKSM